MAEIKHFAFLRHARARPSSYLLHYRRGTVVRAATGIGVWVWPLSDSLVEVPTDDRDVTLVVHGRSADYQDVTVQGSLAYRAVDPERLAGRVDFSLDLESGRYAGEPIDRVESLLSQLAREEVLRFVARTPIRELLNHGIAHIREAVEAALAASPQIVEFGLSVTAVRIVGVKPSPDLEKAIEAPVRELIKQDSDEAAFTRRALAVEKERAIADKEMQSRIELARREEELIEQQGQNARQRALDASNDVRVAALAEADRIDTVESARLIIERRRVEALEDVPGHVLATIAATSFAENLKTIDYLQITPDMLRSIADAFAPIQRVPKG